MKLTYIPKRKAEEQSSAFLFAVINALRAHLTANLQRTTRHRRSILQKAFEGSL